MAAASLPPTPGTLRVIKLDATAQHGTALIAADDAVWVTVALPWWDLSARLWWWLCPHDKKAMLDLTVKDGGRVRTRAIRIARKHVRLSGSAASI
jgi:hypothetical protein